MRSLCYFMESSIDYLYVHLGTRGHLVYAVVYCSLYKLSKNTCCTQANYVLRDTWGRVGS